MDLSMQIDLQRRITRSINILREYARGDKVTVIQDRYECSRQTVLRLARAAGLPKRPKRVVSEAARASILLAWDKGQPLREIALKHGVSEAFVSMHAAQNGRHRYPKDKP